MNIRTFLQRLRAAHQYSKAQPGYTAAMTIANALTAVTCLVLAYGTTGTVRVVWIALAGVFTAMAAIQYVASKKRNKLGELVVKGKDLREVNAFLRSCGLNPPLAPGTHFISVAVVSHGTGYLVMDMNHKHKPEET